MNVQKVIMGLVCVLAVTVAAQPARAQFLTAGEREAIRQNFTSWQQEKTPADSVKTKASAGQKQASRRKAQTAPQNAEQRYIPGREMKMVYSSDYMTKAACYIGKKCWEGICKVGETCGEILREAVRNNAKYGPGGREGAAMRSGELLWKKIASADNQNAVRSQQDSLSKALEQANLSAVKKLQEKK